MYIFFYFMKRSRHFPPRILLIINYENAKMFKYKLITHFKITNISWSSLMGQKTGKEENESVLQKHLSSYCTWKKNENWLLMLFYLHHEILWWTILNYETIRIIFIKYRKQIFVSRYTNTITLYVLTFSTNVHTLEFF